MNTRAIFVAAVAAIATLSAAGTALAQEATPDTWTTLASSQSRAAVQAELQAARQSGALASFRAGYIPRVAVADSRDAVRTDTRQAITSGQVAALNSEAFAFERALPGTLAGSPAVKAAR